ncbi:hypothetical protein LH29_00485 [Draconibacterium sediminis]|uniref:Uncharacterized protein n=2 Tax=Draconibacterium sediminis TaxID=1544798 RepID=A0A0D8JBZ8_9BACT|nr:hypothetical protein LH29_00485 [Draconibacterium sediminis]
MISELKNMSLEDLLEHFLITRGEGELYELVPLLIIAAGSEDEIIRILTRIRNEGKTLKAYYPEFDTVVPAGEYIGEIEDGALYLV